MTPKLDQQVTDEAPCGDTVTDYDRAHLVTYLRLLDASREGADWREAARLVLDRDPDHPASRACWESHMRRAEWMTHTGYKDLAGLQNL
ncbi:DNA -binding domain-containing protein [Caulobacter segnis]|uniref:DNA -binding domain-containing protein n=1 Tax=Caulobacter segnis TaxID=88688 RepID=UPI0028673679|nr:DUF2285 domain-containing protein [Caulobacter segnis]MDR6623872.1 hypothetical protein [Caulobacter segnis]